MRVRLRRASDPLHAKLDNIFAPATLGEREVYADFLSCQLAAHGPIGAWAAANCPPDLAPPDVSSLLIEDLHDLGQPFSHRCGAFALPANADPLGLAWTVAGSHLGNRFILRRLDEVGPDLPRRFLSDRAMPAYWKRIRPRLERECTALEAEPAIAAAIHTFMHFHAAFTRRGRTAAA